MLYSSLGGRVKGLRKTSSITEIMRFIHSPQTTWYLYILSPSLPVLLYGTQDNCSLAWKESAFGQMEKWAAHTCVTSLLDSVNLRLNQQPLTTRLLAVFNSAAWFLHDSSWAQHSEACSSFPVSVVKHMGCIAGSNADASKFETS